MTYAINVSPQYKPRKFRPIKAMGHMRKLLADNEDTDQVFQIMESLNGDQTLRALKSFAQSPKGVERLEERTYLPPILDDHSRWENLPQGTVGRAYIDFMKREGLSAQGLVDESEKSYRPEFYTNDDIEYIGKRFRDTHDLFHILSGYGRDQLGETSLLCFSYSQYGGFGGLFIAYIGTYDLYKTAPKAAKKILFKSLSEARKNGKAAQKIYEEHIPSLMTENLQEARERLGIKPPTYYKQALEILTSETDYRAPLAQAMA